MTISKPDADALGKGIAALTSLGKIKKKRGSSSEGTSENNESIKIISPKLSTFVPVQDTRSPVNLGVSLRPKSDHLASALSPYSQPKKSNKKSIKNAKASISNAKEEEESQLDCDNEATSSNVKKRTPSPLDTVRSPYVPPTLEEINRYNYQGPRRSGSGLSDGLAPIPETTISPQAHSASSELPNDPNIKDYLRRSHMVTERIRFEILLDNSGEEVDVRTKALVIFGKLVNIDPSRKILAYNDEDSDTHPMLTQSHDIPTSLEAMSKYISAPMYNPKANKLQFHTRFRTVTSLLERKRDSSFMSWLKENKIYTSVMTLNSAENTRVGFFIGKCPHITNTRAFSEWIHSRLSHHTNDCPEFQLNIEIIGRHKDPSSQTCAVVIICSRQNVRQLRDLLETVFHAKSNFPFSPFQVMYTLDARTQGALYKAHKSRLLGSNMIEVTIPDFHKLDTLTPSGKSQKSLRDMCFDLKDSLGENLFVDADNATRSHETVLQVRKADKMVVLDNVATWIKNQFSISVNWNESSQYETSTYRLNPKSRALANQLSAIANAPDSSNQRNLTFPPSATHQP